MRKSFFVFFQLMLCMVAAMFYAPAQASPTGFDMAVMQPFDSYRAAPVLAVQTADTVPKPALYFEVVALHSPLQHVPLRHKRQSSDSRMPNCLSNDDKPAIQRRAEVAVVTKVGSAARA